MYNYNNMCGRQKVTLLSILWAGASAEHGSIGRDGNTHQQGNQWDCFCDKVQKNFLNTFWYEDKWYLKRGGSHLGFESIVPSWQNIIQITRPNPNICGFPICKTSVRESSAALTADNRCSIILYIAF